MKEHRYILYDAILLMIVSVFFLGFTLHYRNNLLLIISFVVAEAYFIPRIWKGICLIADSIVGSQKRCTTFLGVLNTDSLDFFRKEYSNIYFDDDEMHKNYIAFTSTIEEDIGRGDAVVVEYYKYSRIVLRMQEIGNRTQGTSLIDNA